MSAAIDQSWIISGIGVYGATVLTAGAGELLRKPVVRRIGVAFLGAAVAFNALIIGLMWVNAGRPPFKTMYETMLLYPFCIAIVGLILFALHRLWLIIPVAAAGALTCVIWAYLRPDLEIVLLPPALQSAWFVPHVVTYFVAYAALGISALLGLLALLKHYASKNAGGNGPIALEDDTNRAAVFGFVFLTIGLGMGAAWGKSAWGEYWAWDPKENWAFITWLAYLAYLHTRLLPAWRGVKSMWLNVACFAAVMFTYLGMHLLPSAGGSLHVYQ